MGTQYKQKHLIVPELDATHFERENERESIDLRVHTPATPVNLPQFY